MRVIWVSTLALLLSASSAFAGDYCLAIRGNGELAAAQWGAMANLVKRLGLPKTQAGGGSATITMMLNEAVATNPFVRNAATDEERNLRAALLIKSFEGFVDYLPFAPEWRDLLLMFPRDQAQKNLQWLESMQTFLKTAADQTPAEASAWIKTHAEYLKTTYNIGKQLGLINESGFEPLKRALEKLATGDVRPLQLALNYTVELRDSIRKFGTFDPRDANIFFRPGLIDFEQLARQLGRMATFYTATEPSRDEIKLWDDFFLTCAASGADLTWPELIGANRECGKTFNRLVEMHLAGKQNWNFGDRNIGLRIDTYLATAVIAGASIERTMKWLQAYAISATEDFGAKFSLVDPDQDLLFGYWGEPANLRAIRDHLPSDKDEKSRRFKALGMASWKKALALSAGEPGMAPLQLFTDEKNEEFYSAGGWSDQHPVLLLEAAGCERIVYLTRRGGESTFAQGVAKRLLNLNRSWEAILSEEENSRGDLRDTNSFWSKFFNLANYESSIRRALGRADAVMCMDWNPANGKNGTKDIVREAYRKSQFYLRPGSNFKKRDIFTPQLNPSDELANGVRTYAGCY